MEKTCYNQHGIRLSTHPIDLQIIIEKASKSTGERIADVCIGQMVEFLWAIFLEYVCGEYPPLPMRKSTDCFHPVHAVELIIDCNFDWPVVIQTEREIVNEFVFSSCSKIE